MLVVDVLAATLKREKGLVILSNGWTNPPHSALSDDIDIVAEQNNQFGELKLSNEESMQIDALEKTGIPLEEVRGQIEDRELPTVEARLQMEDGEADEPSDEADEIFGGSTEVHPASAVNNISENHNSVILQTRMDDFAMENVQASLTTLVATLSDPPSQDLMRKYLMAYLFQELGRITYPSGHVAISALTAFTRGSFPNFHPNMVHEENSIAAPPCVEGFSPGSDDEP